MGKYILKRLLIAVITLLGVTVITFLLIRLAPGDPGSINTSDESRSSSRETLSDHYELTRKLYGLDKPILINFDVMDARRTVLSAWEEFIKSSETNDKLEKRLLSFKKRLIPYLVPIAIELSDSDQHELALRLLRDGAGVKSAQSAGALAVWWKEHESDYRQDSIYKEVSYLENCSEDENDKVVASIQERLSELALPLVISRIESIEDSPARRRLIAYAASFAGYSFKLKPDTDQSKYLNAQKFIERWWDSEGLAYREIGAFERFVKTFTEAQYPIWLGKIITLDFGESYITHRPVTEMVFEAFKVTFTFQIIVIFLIYLISVPIGVFSAVKQNTVMDRIVTFSLFTLYSLPSFWVAYMLILLLGSSQFAEIFPVQGLNSIGSESMTFWPWLWDRLWHMALPVACMTYGGLAVLSRFVRAGMLENIRKDYIRTARAKGLSERAVIIRHALRNSLIPIVTLLGGLLPALISGSVIIEKIFNIPGMGRLSYQAALQRDYHLIMAVAFFFAVLVLLGILLSDILYALVDPRIKFGEKQ